MNIGNFARAQILLGKSNSEILDLIRIQFPDGKTTAACVAWYKSDMRKKGMLEAKVPAKALTREQLLEQLAALEAAKVPEEQITEAETQS